MDLRLYLRAAEKRRDIGATGEQAVEHDRFLRQDKRHDIRGVYLTHIHRQGIGRQTRSYAVGIEMLAGTLEGKMADGERGIRSAIRESALAERVDGVTQRDRTRQAMQVDQRRFVISREMGLEMQISSVATSAFLPGKTPGQKSLASSSPWGHQELDMTE